MLFQEPAFLFVFFPTVLAAYVALAAAGAGALRGVLLLASIAFYGWSEPRFAFLVLLSGALDWRIARAIAARADRARTARLLLALGVVANLALLVHFKYTRFLIESLDALLAGLALPTLSVPDIALPIGVSFVVFEKITYLVDVFRGISPTAPTLRLYLTYVFFFPKLLAGPIVKYHDLAPQLRALRRPSLDDVAIGFSRFMLGVVKKVLLADTLALGADMIFDDPNPPGFTEAWWGIAFFTFQIFFDFSAYSDMAIGLARMFGLRIMENFDRPYTSASITEFWRRWHISLSSWIREYLYIPLGGNRVTPWRRYANLWLCFLASGLWHGAGWTFVLWGAWHGLFLVLDKLFLLRWLSRLPRPVAVLLTFAVVSIGWTVFRAHSLEQAGAFLSALVDPARETRSARIYITGDIKLSVWVAALICVLPRWLPRMVMAEASERERAGQFIVRTALALLFVCALGKAVADPFKAFLYFRF